MFYLILLVNFLIFDIHIKYMSTSSIFLEFLNIIQNKLELHIFLINNKYVHNL